MDVGCPKCQSEYELDDARVTDEGVTVKCTSCGHVFRVKKKQLVVTLPVKADSPPPHELGTHSTDLPPPPPSREWKLRQPNGNVYPCRDLTMLQKWIIEGKVQRDDEISLTGETWKRLGNIPELASFFQIVEDASKARAMEALSRTNPPLPPAPSAPTGGKITDTWRGGTFSEPVPQTPALAAEPDPEPPQAETLPPEPPPKRQTGKLPQFAKEAAPAEPPLMETLKGGRFSPLPPLPAPPRRHEPTDEELRRAVGKGGGSGKWLALVVAGLGVGGGVGWYLGVYEPEQQRLIAERASTQAKLDEEARIQALEAAKPPVVVSDASVEVEDAGLPDAGSPDAGVPDAGAPVVDAGVGAPVVVEQKKTFDYYLAQGERLRDREKAAQALDMYGLAHDLKPERVEPVAGKGLALLDMANPSAAEAAFEEALKLNNRYGPAIMGIAEAFRMQGKNEKAVEFYQRYLDVLPNGSEAAVARNSIERLKK
jgi:predicted Zn finger-like uncharacterized protein